EPRTQTPGDLHKRKRPSLRVAGRGSDRRLPPARHVILDQVLPLTGSSRGGGIIDLARWGLWGVSSTGAARPPRPSHSCPPPTGGPQAGVPGQRWTHGVTPGMGRRRVPCAVHRELAPASCYARACPYVRALLLPGCYRSSATRS